MVSVLVCIMFSHSGQRYLGFKHPTIPSGEQRLILFNAGYIGYNLDKFSNWILCANHRHRFSVGQDPRKQNCCRSEAHPECHNQKSIAASNPLVKRKLTSRYHKTISWRKTNKLL